MGEELSVASAAVAIQLSLITCSDVHRVDVFSSCCSVFVFAVTVIYIQNA